MEGRETRISGSLDMLFDAQVRAFYTVYFIFYYYILVIFSFR